MSQKEKKTSFDGNAEHPPTINSYYALWGKHEFCIESQRNLLLWFLAEKKLDLDFMKFLDYWFPEDEEGVRQRRNINPDEDG